MRSNRFLLSCLLFAVFYSCKKDSTVTGYPSVYHKTGVSTISDLRLFSFRGEIRDPAIISRFKQLDTSHFRVYARSLGEAYLMDTVILQDPQHGAIRNNFEWKNCLTSQSGNRLTLITNEIFTGFSSGDEFTSTPDYYIGNTRPEVLTEYIISSTRGSYSFGYTGRQKFLFDNYGQQLLAPMIIFTHRRKDQQHTWFVNNSVKEDFYKSMQVGDTLSLITCQLLYEK